MRKGPLRILFGIAIAAAIFYVGFVIVSGSTIIYAGRSPTPSHLILENHASEPVREANIELLGRGYLLRGIEPNQSATLDFSFRSPGSYKINIVFRSGRQLTMDEGYLDSFAEVTNTLTITDDGIRITTTCVKTPNAEPSCTHPEIP